MDQLARGWTDDELVNEIRRRERQRGRGAGGPLNPSAGRARDLATSRPVNWCAPQRGAACIYGSDDRQDIYKV